MKKYIIILALIILANYPVLAGHWNVNGWNWIENKDKIVLWQKKGEHFISEALINISVPLCCEIVMGYSIKLNDDISLSDYQCNNLTVGFWKINYYGFDGSDNIYLKVLREKEEISDKDISKLKEEILKISNVTEVGEDIIERRLELFDNLLEKYFKEEGDTITVNPSKIIVINGLNNIPPFKIEVNGNNSIINVSVIGLE